MFVETEAEKYVEGDYTIRLDEHHILNRDMLSSSLLKINDEGHETFVLTIHQFNGDFEKSGLHIISEI